MEYKYFTYYVFEKGYPEQRQARGKVIHYDEDKNIYVLEINFKGENE